MYVGIFTIKPGGGEFTGCAHYHWMRIDIATSAMENKSGDELLDQFLLKYIYEIDLMLYTTIDMMFNWKSSILSEARGLVS